MKLKEQAVKEAEAKQGFGRREFTKLALMGTLGGSGLLSHAKQNTPKFPSLMPGIKVAVQMGPDPSDEDLQFVKQLGAEYITIWLHSDGSTYDNFMRLCRKVEGAGLKIWNIGNSDLHNMSEVVLNLPGRDGKIEAYKAYLRNLGKAGITYTTYAHMGNGIWSSAPEKTRGGATARAFDMSKSHFGQFDSRIYNGPLTHGRLFTEDQIWENYDYFIKAVVPVAEEAGVRIGIHPDDPPAPQLGGVPRCIFSSFEGYKKAFEIANSRNIGICLCCGTWLEGGRSMGKDLLETIQYFGARDKIFKVHFRNVSAPLPHFVETFVDDGYMDMAKVMQALQKVDFSGALIADHIPAMVGGPRVGTAYSVGYIRALLKGVTRQSAA